MANGQSKVIPASFQSIPAMNPQFPDRRPNPMESAFSALAAGLAGVAAKKKQEQQNQQDLLRSAFAAMVSKGMIRPPEGSTIQVGDMNFPLGMPTETRSYADRRQQATWEYEQGLRDLTENEKRSFARDEIFSLEKNDVFLGMLTMAIIDADTPEKKMKATQLRDQYLKERTRQIESRYGLNTEAQLKKPAGVSQADWDTLSPENKQLLINKFANK